MWRGRSCTLLDKQQASRSPRICLQMLCINRKKYNEVLPNSGEKARNSNVSVKSSLNHNKIVNCECFLDKTPFKLELATRSPKHRAIDILNMEHSKSPSFQVATSKAIIGQSKSSVESYFQFCLQKK